MITKDDVVTIDLDEAEHHHAALAGFERHYRNLGSAGSAGMKGDHWAPDIDGAVGEYAASLALGMSWVPVRNSYAERREPKFVAFTTAPKNNLIVSRKADPALPYVLVAGLGTPRFISDTGKVVYRYYVVGWIWGEEAKNEKYWRDDVPRPAFFVPKEELHSIATFQARYRARKAALASSSS